MSEREPAEASRPEDPEAETQEGYRRYAPSLARIPRHWPMATEPAHVFDPRPFAPAPQRRDDE